ncbi:TusE/DsrC/DsvC family sulfur relay protein [Candidatus Portiera aleyrodidarum]|uniref:TusE/DsrC/DsvC family sulfur relay protein n=1 Tax=Candidatus Portiera aleyrodidarum TaxID=91844 RepID=UPI0020B1324D|nr:TusE/DsrC/DsvC family sulfur relay protein [Candidatus Portiera aleyrodidarum]
MGVQIPRSVKYWYRKNNIKNNRLIEVDCEGFLKSIKNWSPYVGYIIANKEGRKLHKPHWEIILLLRKFYETYKIAPNMVTLINELKFINYKKGNSIYLLKVFRSYKKTMIKKTTSTNKKDYKTKYKMTVKAKTTKKTRLFTYVHKKTNITKKKEYMLKLYINAESPARIAARIAGLPKPNNCM